MAWVPHDLLKVTHLQPRCHSVVPMMWLKHFSLGEPEDLGDYMCRIWCQQPNTSPTTEKGTALLVPSKVPFQSLNRTKVEFRGSTSTFDAGAKADKLIGWLV